MSSNTTDNNEEEYIWNFAIGSNMNTKVLEGRRKIFPIEKIPGFCTDHALVFSVLTLPYFEPAMAAICSKKNTTIHGLLVKLTKKQFNHLYMTEGGPSGGYRPLPVKVEAYDGRIIDAIAFADKTMSEYREEKEGTPSRRYMNIIIEGAKENKLDPNYILYLESIKAFQAGLIVKILFALLHLPLLLVVFLIFTLRFMMLRVGGRAFLAPVLGALINVVRKVLWISHDYIFSKILGNGGRKVGVEKKTEE